MKRFIILVSFLFFGIVSAQNVISLTFQPVDLGLGLKYDRLFVNHGLYASISKGQYRLDESFIKDHFKLATGVSIHVGRGNLSVGICYHRFGEVMGYFPPATFDPVSFEFGCNGELKRLIIGFRFDPVKGESSFDFGIRL